MKTNRSVAVSNKKVRSRLSVRRHAAHTAAELFALMGPSTPTGSQVKASLNTGVLWGVLSPRTPKEPLCSPMWCDKSLKLELNT